MSDFVHMVGTLTLIAASILALQFAYIGLILALRRARDRKSKGQR